ncbi:MFS transporter [Palleronia aestuarii]|uniref:MFS transporter n=1 Tax=Palleronia aestuarii TaxID=568105 RepID=A0A2W7NHQ2_9RHOB|nr:MFS transporter [Palleronia aestuarii]PZX18983.1 MFS transporter [Palleronia aestuarii]
MPFLTFLRSNAPFLLVGVLLTFCSSFGQTFFISVFGGVIREEFALSNGGWGILYSIATTASAIVMVFAGAATDRFRVRVIGPIVLGLLAMACVVMAMAPGPVILGMAISALRLCGQGMCVLVAAVAMARWFVARRGLALSISAVGVEAGSALLPLAFVSAMPLTGWRELWIVAACIVLAVVPLLWPLLRLERTPQSISEDPQSAGMGSRHWQRGEMLRHPLFWFIAPAILAPAAFGTAFFFHQVHLAETKGFTHLELVALFPVFTAAAMVTVFASGPIVDRVGTARLMPLYQMPMALGFVGLAFADTLPLAAICIGLMGMTQGMNAVVPNAFWAEFYGTRHMGAIRSLAAAIMVFGTALGPALTGLLIDAGVILEDQFAGIAVYFVLTSALVAVGIARSRVLQSAAA